MYTDQSTIKQSQLCSHDHPYNAMEFPFEQYSVTFYLPINYNYEKKI